MTESNSGRKEKYVGGRQSTALSLSPLVREWLLSLPKGHRSSLANDILEPYAAKWKAKNSITARLEITGQYPNVHCKMTFPAKPDKLLAEWMKDAKFIRVDGHDGVWQATGQTFSYWYEKLGGVVEVIENGERRVIDTKRPMRSKENSQETRCLECDQSLCFPKESEPFSWDESPIQIPDIWNVKEHGSEGVNVVWRYIWSFNTNPTGKPSLEGWEASYQVHVFGLVGRDHRTSETGPRYTLRDLVVAGVFNPICGCQKVVC